MAKWAPICPMLFPPSTTRQAPTWRTTSGRPWGSTPPASLRTYSGTRSTPWECAPAVGRDQGVRQEGGVIGAHPAVAEDGADELAQGHRVDAALSLTGGVGGHHGTWCCSSMARRAGASRSRLYGLRRGGGGREGAGRGQTYKEATMAMAYPG